MKVETIYKVRTEGDEEGRSMKTLGCASGTVDDIKEYFNEQKMYGVHLEQTNILYITKQDVEKKSDLYAQKSELETKLNKLTNEMKNRGLRV